MLSDCDTSFLAWAGYGKWLLYMAIGEEEYGVFYATGRIQMIQFVLNTLAISSQGEPQDGEESML